MTMREAYEAYIARQEQEKVSRYGAHYYRQEKNYVEPFRLYGPVWYVGDSWVCVHLIDTGDGLLLIDSGNSGATAMLIQSIWKAGFNPADVKWIIHSHGHMDHFGAANFFKTLFGTKLYIGAPDAKMFRERPWLTLVHTTCDDMDCIFEPDVEIHDGDVLKLGNLQIECVLCPGHTDGVVSLFFEADGEEGVKRFGYYGGFGFNTLEKDYLLEIGDPEFKMRQTYLDSLAKVRDEKVEIMLGNHTANNRTLEKRQMQLENPGAPNPFVEPDCWRNYLDSKRDELLEFMKKPENN